MDITILGQGFNTDTKNSVGHQLIKFLGQKDCHTFVGLSAFASQAGVNGLSKHITSAKKNFKNLIIIVGVDQKGTSKEALEAILALGIKSYVFYQPSVTIYHSKIYLFEGDKTSTLIVGSSNLTAQGLFSNIETSILMDLDNSIEADKKVVRDLKNYFKGIFDYKDPNLKKLTAKLIKDLVKAKVVPTEAERKAEQEKTEKPEGKETENLISKIFPKRAIAKIPSEFRGTGKTVKKTVKMTGKPASKGNLVWTRKSLPASSVQLTPSGKNTGGLRLVKDRFVVGGKIIDQTSYFRKTVFAKYKWKQVRTAPYGEVATVPFEVTIKGKFQGKSDLKIRHKPTGEAGQGNYTTSISWGDLGDTIRKANLTGSRLDLIALKGKGNSFSIIIS